MEGTSEILELPTHGRLSGVVKDKMHTLSNGMLCELLLSLDSLDGLSKVESSHAWHNLLVWWYGGVALSFIPWKQVRDLKGFLRHHGFRFNDVIDSDMG